MSNTNSDLVRDALLNRFEDLTDEIARILDAKDKRLMEVEAERQACQTRIAELTAQLAAAQQELARERGLPI